MILRYLYTRFRFDSEMGREVKGFTIRFLSKRFFGGSYRYQWIRSIVNHATRDTFFFFFFLSAKANSETVCTRCLHCSSSCLFFFCFLFCLAFVRALRYIIGSGSFTPDIRPMLIIRNISRHRYTVHVAGIMRDEFYPATFQTEEISPVIYNRY